VIGEHGDSQCVRICPCPFSRYKTDNLQVAWSAAQVSGIPLSHLLPLKDSEKSEIATATKEKAYEIIKTKGFTSYGIGAVTSTICEAIIFDQRHIYPLSHWCEDLKCCLSLPAIIGRSGIIETVSLPLNKDEADMMIESAKSMRDIMEKHDSK
jgi:L-lactate dehydrogenase